MEGRVFYKLVCVDESDPLEYQTLEDINCGCLEEVHEYVTKNIAFSGMLLWSLHASGCYYHSVHKVD